MYYRLAYRLENRHLFTRSEIDGRDPSQLAAALFFLGGPHYAVPREVITAYPGKDNGEGYLASGQGN